LSTNTIITIDRHISDKIVVKATLKPEATFYGRFFYTWYKNEYTKVEIEITEDTEYHITLPHNIDIAVELAHGNIKYRSLLDAQLHICEHNERIADASYSENSRMPIVRLATQKGAIVIPHIKNKQ
jgi:hypothetical protein